MAHSDAVHAYIQQYVDQANANVSRAESVRKFIVLPHDFSVEEGMMTASMKVVRPKVLAAYAGVIEGELYAPVPSNRPVPVSVQILESTTETVKRAGESMRHASENVSPRVRQAIDTVQERLGEWQQDHAETAEDASAAKEPPSQEEER